MVLAQTRCDMDPPVDRPCLGSHHICLRRSVTTVSALISIGTRSNYRHIDRFVGVGPAVLCQACFSKELLSWLEGGVRYHTRCVDVWTDREISPQPYPLAIVFPKIAASEEFPSQRAEDDEIENEF